MKKLTPTILGSWSEYSRRNIRTSAERPFQTTLHAGTSHVTAFVGAFAACLGAPLAVLDLMLLAFTAAGFTHLSALRQSSWANCDPRLIHWTASEQMSAQSRSSRIHSAMLFTSFSRRQAVAQCSHSWAHWTQAAIQD